MSVTVQSAPRKRSEPAEAWMYAFGPALLATLALFVWQMAHYTTVLG